MKGVGKKFIIINGFKYRYITSKSNEDIKKCEQFIRNKIDEHICWDHFVNNEKIKNNIWRYFLFNNKYHRDDGPAIILKDESGNVTFSNWCIEGEYLTEEEKLNEIRRINLDLCLD